MLRTALLAFVLSLGIAAAPAAEVVTTDGGRYSGPIVDGKLQGKGRIEWQSGAFYDGEFANGVFSGQGHYHFATGDEYRGEMRNGTFWGKGELRYRNGRVYRGEFVRGLMQGKGRLENGDTDSYEGDFEKDAFIRGTYKNKDGSSYEGDFRDYVFNGKGRYSDGKGNVWEGNFVNGQLDGKGVLKLANGDVYEGMFSRGMYHGQGTLTHAKPNADGQTRETGAWQYGSLKNDREQAKTQSNVETALYSEQRLLDQAFGALKPRDPGRINMYLLAVAGDGSQEVFHREVDYVQKEFAGRFGTAGHTLALVNSRNTVGSLPMATTTSIRESLKAIASRMDRDEDILFLFMTSHGSRDHQFYLNQTGMQLESLPAAKLAELLKESGIRWKVVVVSACYSGGFIEPLQDGHSLILTAARKDRTSFGCADENDFTYFGRAYFKESLPTANSFQEAFRKAEALVRQWELKDAGGPAYVGTAKVSVEHSYPQMSVSLALDERLKRWWSQNK